MQVNCWQMTAVGEPLVRATRDEASPTGDEVLIKVRGCGICHTDLGFLFDGVPVRSPLPLTLGHEISGKVLETGPEASEWAGREVIVPAVLPCGECDLCRAGRGSICPQQVFPGNDVHGGFASHLKIRSRGLCPVPDLSAADVDIVELSVLADAVTTPYQSIRRSGLKEGDLAVFVGVGGVGGFGVQIAAALGARVVAIDVDDERALAIAQHGADLTLNPTDKTPREVKKAVQGFAKREGLPKHSWKIFETSGTAPGQELAFGLLVHGAYLGVIGFTPAKVTTRLSNLMAFDATAEGNWGCLPELYPEALDLVVSGKVAVRPFVQKHMMSQVNEVMAAVQRREIKQRPVLLPDF